MTFKSKMAEAMKGVADDLNTSSDSYEKAIEDAKMSRQKAVIHSQEDPGCAYFNGCPDIENEVLSELCSDSVVLSDLFADGYMGENLDLDGTSFIVEGGELSVIQGEEFGTVEGDCSACCTTCDHGTKGRKADRVVLKPQKLHAKCTYSWEQICKMGGFQRVLNKVERDLRRGMTKAIERHILYASPEAAVNDYLVQAYNATYLTPGSGLYATPTYGVIDHATQGPITWDKTVGTCVRADRACGESLVPGEGTPNFMDGGTFSAADLLKLTGMMTCCPERTVILTNKHGENKIKLDDCFSCNPAALAGSAAYGGRLRQSPWGMPVFRSDCLLNVNAEGAPGKGEGFDKCPFLAIDVDAVKRGFACDGLHQYVNEIKGCRRGYEFGIEAVFLLGIQDGQACDDRSIAMMCAK